MARTGRATISFAERTETLFGDPRVSHWLKRSLASALARDPEEAVRDTELLLSLLSERLTSVCGAARN